MNGKKALQLASVASMIDQFNIPNIKLLQSLGCKVDVAADFTHPGTITAKRAKELSKRLNGMDVRIHDIAIPRALNPRAICSAYKTVKKLIDTERYDLVHCHSPIGAAICRLAARKSRKSGTKVLYTAHGFHFFKGAPLKNWLIYYPMESLMSRFTDSLITINSEDYALASKKLHALSTDRIHGIGIDIDKLRNRTVDTAAKRKELGISENDIMLLSVGELNANKNHRLVIRALAELAMKNVHYFIAGLGDLDDELSSLIAQLHVADRVHLIGFRNDVAELCHTADLFVFPSLREGLSVALMEAIACGTPVICGRIRGNRELVPNENCLFDPASLDSLKACMKRVLVGKTRKELNESMAGEAESNLKNLALYDQANVQAEMRAIYRRYL